MQASFSLTSIIAVDPAAACGAASMHSLHATCRMSPSIRRSTLFAQRYGHECVSTLSTTPIAGHAPATRKRRQLATALGGRGQHVVMMLSRRGCSPSSWTRRS